MPIKIARVYSYSFAVIMLAWIPANEVRLRPGAVTSLLQAAGQGPPTALLYTTFFIMNYENHRPENVGV